MKIHPGSIGIDVSKTHLDVFDADTDTITRIANDDAAVAGLAARLAGRSVFVVFEATGRYDGRLRRALAAAGVAFARVNPEQARHFAKANGIRAKTDQVDARLLAAMAGRLDLRTVPVDDEERRTLADLAARRDQLVMDRQKEKVRRSEGAELWRDSIERHLAFYDAEIAEIESQIRDLTRKSALLAKAIGLLRSIPGIGPVAALTLVALMPELGRLSPKAAAALAGLAPFNRDSGAFRGIRSIAGGRKRVRDALYMAANAARRSRSRFAAFFDDLIQRNKPFKVAIIAVARKILVTANAVLRDQMPFAGAA
jgi:transposase